MSNDKDPQDWTEIPVQTTEPTPTPVTQPMGIDEPLPGGDDRDEVVESEVDVPTPVQPTEQAPVDDTDTAEDEAYPVDEQGDFYEADIKPRKPIFKDASAKQNWLAGITLLRTTLNDWEKRGGAGNMEDLTEDSQMDWWYSMATAMDQIFPGSGLMGAMTREGAQWDNEIPTMREKGPALRPRELSFNIRREMESGGRNLRGHKATEAFVTGTKVGRTVQIPLWRTGIWVTMRPPALSYLAEIDRALAFARPQLGLDTMGMLNSNEALIFEEVLVDAALRLITSSTYPFAQSPMELRDIISSHDRDQLIWGMALAAFPDGTDIALPCTDAECSQVDRVHANVLRMAFVDRGSLTLDQLRLMDRATNTKVTDEELDKYQADFEVRERGYWEYEGRKLNFYVATLTEYFSTGRQWINSINIAVTQSMGDDVENDNKRARSIESMVSSEQLCRYGHYIRNITIPVPGAEDNDDDESDLVIDYADDIRNILKLISADPDAVNSLLLAIDNYIQRSVVSVIAYPNAPCSKCGKLHLTRGEARVLIPFPASTGFFTLAQHKMRLGGIPVSTDLSMLGIRNFVQQVSANEQMISSAQPQP